MIELEIHLQRSICDCDDLPEWEFDIGPDQQNIGIRLTCEHCGAEHFSYIDAATLVLDEEGPDDPGGEPLPENVIPLVRKVG